MTFPDIHMRLPYRLEGSASAMLARGDYGLQIPEVPRVANVDEEVLLEIDFVVETK